MNKKFLVAAALTLSALNHDIQAQSSPPDAGQIQRDTSQPGITAPKKPKLKALPKLENPVIRVSPKSGATVLIKSVKFTGNTVISSEELTTVIQPLIGKNQSLDDLRAMAQVVNDYYHEKGYYFARTIIPVQEFSDGVLTLSIQEGRYGNVEFRGEDYIAKGSAPYLSDLKRGDVIDLAKLESALLRLDDVPGVSIFPVITEGTESGTADITLTSRIDLKSGGEIEFDNNGSRYTGPYRISARWYNNHNLTFGDNIELNAIASDANLWLGSFNYNIPIGGSGLVGQLRYSYTSYELGKDYAPLGATGNAHVWSGNLGYNFIRSQKTNLHLSVSYQHKDLNDHYAQAGVDQHKTSDSFPVTLHFDRRDTFLSGGILFGLITWTPGTLNLTGSQLTNDQGTAQSNGYFNKLNLDIVRIQTLADNISLYLRYSQQFSDKNLDSSERMNMGGADGVRAYPIGEGTGDEGWLGQVELRYLMDEY
ncbi:MAG: ShlB/FhaC/HecB family hemolysin secretion/activation protein, partial [Chitinophagia bacterium]|nr:ShlB/FhaC/HecB family hemolysin secretion/activation protein [Chitinophagia bacterium]